LTNAEKNGTVIVLFKNLIFQMCRNLDLFLWSWRLYITTWSYQTDQGHK